MFEYVCERIRDFRDALGAYAEGFDPSLITTAQAEEVVEHAAAIEKMAASLKGAAAARAADGGAWRRNGARSPAHDLARRSGGSVSQAGDTLATARRLRSLPAASAAARRGELSPSQASAIAEAAELNPGAETRLVQKARCASLAELRDDCAATKAAVSDAEAQRRRIHARRYLRSRTDAEGGGHLHFYDTPEIVAEIEKALAPRRDELWRAARAAGKPERVEACAADALAEAVKANPAEAPPAPNRNGSKSAGLDKLIARIDLPAWLRGYPIDEESCELVGYGPVAVSALRDMVASGDPFLAAVATKGVDVVSVAHLGRRPTAHQQTALEWLFPTCAAEGCNERVRLQNDHRAPWADTHITLLGLLERLCARDHWLKTHRGWALVAGTGKRPFVPPDDPRHPRNAGGQERPPP